MAVREESRPVARLSTSPLSARRWAAGLSVVAAAVAVRGTFAAASPDPLASALTPWTLFVPPLLLAGGAAFLMTAAASLPPRRLAGALAVVAAVLLTAVPIEVLREAATYSIYDDGAAYLVQAQFMREHRTLMAGQPTFATQPGYPYALLPLLALPGFPNRFHQLALAMVLVIGVAAGTQALRQELSDETPAFRAATMAFPLLALPYFVKNLYLNLPEWLVFLLLIGALVLWRRGWILAAAACLAFIAVLRQNLLPASLLLQAVVAMDAWRRGQRGSAGLAFAVWFVIIMTPAFHNFHYGGTFALLAKGRTLNLIDDWMWRPWARMAETVLKYAGYSTTTSPQGLLFAIPSVPTGSLLAVWAGQLLMRRSRLHGLLFLVLTASVVVPTALLGLAYYPRFELVNLAVAWVGYEFLRLAALPSAFCPAT